MIISAKAVIDYIPRCLLKMKVPMIHGDPGIGKSDIIRQIAEKYKLKVLDIRMSTADPVDLNGFPMIIDGRANYVPFDTFPLAGLDEVPDGYNGWLIFLDEFNSASLAVQAACYKLILDRMVGNHKLHEKSRVICAGNLASNGAIVNRMGTAMQSRLVHMHLVVTAEDWLYWGNRNGIDHRVLAYINNVPGNLHVFDPKHNDFTFACHRTWHATSDLIKGVATRDLKDLTALIAGTIGEGIAHEFVAYTEVYSSLPTYQEIINSPKTVGVSTEPGMLFAVSYMIANFLKKKDQVKALEYLERLPKEFQSITLQNVVCRDMTFINEKPIMDWCLHTGLSLI